MLTEREVLLLYAEWSEECWGADFILSSPREVEQFRAWIPERLRRGLEDYERDMLEEYHRQERAQMDREGIHDAP